MKGSDFVFCCLDKTYYSSHKTTFRGSGLYIKHPYWMKNKIAHINPKNRNTKCFKYAILAPLHHNEINNNSETLIT